MRPAFYWIFASVPLAVGLGAACSEDVQLGQNFGGSIGLPAAGAGGLGAGGESGFPVDVVPDPLPIPPVQPNPGVCEPVRCGGTESECGNCVDDDQDGLVDANDPECLGPCDNSEAELFSGFSARVTGCRTDCYFDDDAGRGNDRCNRSLACDPLSPGGDCGGEASGCEVTQACQDRCRPLVPNGCDCFGCCELPAGSGTFIWLGSESLEQAHCELETSADRDRCKPCTPVAECMNECGECELCVGKSASSLPASCGALGSARCADGVTPCDPGMPGACGTTHYCITGCCVPLPR